MAKYSRGPCRDWRHDPSLWGSLALAMVHIIMCSGTVYGWAALQPQMEKAGYFDQREKPHDLFGIVATVGIGANAVCRLPLGLILDKSGPRRTSILGGLFFTFGMLLMSRGNPNSLFQVTFGYFLIGAAGPLVQTPTFQFTERFDEYKGTATSVLVACFELSTGGFFVFGLLENAYGITLRHLFDVWAVFGVFISVTAALFWPDQPYRPLVIAPPSPQGDRPEDYAALRNIELRRQVFTMKFLYTMCFMAVHILRQSFMLISIFRQNEATFGRKVGTHLSKIFSMILPLGFLPFLIFTSLGYANRLLKNPDVAFAFASFVSMISMLPLLIRSQADYIFAFLVFPFGRQLVFSAFFGSVGTTFGFRNFGLLTGIVSTVAGIVQLVVQRMLLDAGMDGWPGAPGQESTRWLCVNTFVILLPVPLLIWALRDIRARRNRMLQPGMMHLLGEDHHVDTPSSRAATPASLFATPKP